MLGAVPGADHHEAASDLKLGVDAASRLGRGEVNGEAKRLLQERERSRLIGVPQMGNDARCEARLLTHDPHANPRRPPCLGRN